MSSTKASIKHRGFKWTVNDASNPTLAIALDDTSQALHIARASDVNTDWNVSADSNAAIYVHSDTTPATDYIVIGRHTGTAADIDLVGGATLNFKIDGTTEASLTASGFDLASADLQMQTGGQILDNNGNELVEFVIGNASAVNGIRIVNSATGVKPIITNEGEADTGITFANWDGTNTEELLVLVATASATNGIRIVNSATGVKPIITNEGEVDTGITFANYDGTNTEEILVLQATATATNGIRIVNNTTGLKPIITNEGEADTGITLANWDGTNTEEILVLVATASATNGIRIVNNTTGLNPTITNEGEADTGITLANFDGTNTEELLILDAVATAVNELTISNAATGARPKIAATGETNVGLTLDTKGTGDLMISLGGVEALMFDDADDNFAGEADTAGHAIFILAENAGAASADTSGTAGATITITAGDGAAGGAHVSNNPNGGDGGDLVLNPGAAGAAGGGGGGAAGAAGLIKFGTAGCWTANGTSSVTLSDVAPAGVTTATISKWLTVKDNTGATYFIPAWT